MRNCAHCGRSFRPEPHNVRAGNGRFCSRACHYASRLRPLPERFWAKVRKSDGCWEWTGRTQKGYGSITREGAGSPTVWAHRLSWELHFGAIPPGLFVCHTCDNRRCVRPDHLWLGTNQQNLADMRRKGRDNAGAPCGERNGSAKLTEDDIRQIRAEYRPKEVSQAELARRYRVSQAVISAIVRHKIWKQIH